MDDLTRELMMPNPTFDIRQRDDHTVECRCHRDGIVRGEYPYYTPPRGPYSPPKNPTELRKAQREREKNRQPRRRS